MACIVKSSAQIGAQLYAFTIIHRRKERHGSFHIGGSIKGQLGVGTFSPFTLVPFLFESRVFFLHFGRIHKRDSGNFGRSAGAIDGLLESLLYQSGQ